MAALIMDSVQISSCRQNDNKGYRMKLIIRCIQLIKLELLFEIRKILREFVQRIVLVNNILVGLIVILTVCTTGFLVGGRIVPGYGLTLCVALPLLAQLFVGIMSPGSIIERCRFYYAFSFDWNALSLWAVIRMLFNKSLPLVSAWYISSAIAFQNKEIGAAILSVAAFLLSAIVINAVLGLRNLSFKRSSKVILDILALVIIFALSKNA